MKEEIKEIAEKSFQSGIYKKNIHYIFKEDFDIREFQMAGLLSGSPGESSWIIQQAYRKIGSQMQVSKEVSNDLEHTDFGEASQIENINWVSKVIEVYFEDPRLPSILIANLNKKDLNDLFPKLEVGEACHNILALMQEGSDELEGKHLNLQLRPGMYNDFLETGDCPAMQGGFFSSPLSQSDNASICYMLHLALKVLVFASIPKFKPNTINSKKEMKIGGKPGVKGRPARPSFKVIYLPKVLSEKPSSFLLNQKNHEFLGRRGFLRHYFHPRFTFKKGTWDFIAPVKNPKTGKYPISLYRVRKPVIS